MEFCLPHLGRAETPISYADPCTARLLFLLNGLDLDLFGIFQCTHCLFWAYSNLLTMLEALEVLMVVFGEVEFPLAEALFPSIGKLM